MQDRTAELIAELTRKGLTIATAESLTGGLLVAELIRPAGASATVLGGVVAYTVDLKHSLLGVGVDVLSLDGAVNGAVAEQMAAGVRNYLATSDAEVSIGLATTGVAGPDEHEGVPPGVVYVGLSIDDRIMSRKYEFPGGRDDVRAATVAATVLWLCDVLGLGQ